MRIHDLDVEDKSLIETELEGILRPIDFIYKSSGVNRPLKHNDDRAENQNHTYYRDQINKVANAVKETIIILKQPSGSSSTNTLNNQNGSSPAQKTNTALDSIAVLPFANMSSDPEQEYFSDGISEEIINTLAQLPMLIGTKKKRRSRFIMN